MPAERETEKRQIAEEHAKAASPVETAPVKGVMSTLIRGAAFNTLRGGAAKLGRKLTR